MRRGTVALAALVVAAYVAATGGNAAPPRHLRVGFVVYSGVVPSQRSIEGQMFVGFLQADKRPGVEGRVQYIPPSQDPTGALQSLGRQGYDLIIAAFPGPFEAIASNANRFPRVRFLLPDAPIEVLAGRPKNIQGSDYRAEEAGYLAGYLAALMEQRRHGKHVISAVGGIPYPGVARWIVPYAAGAKRADPAVRVMIGYSNDFANPAKCRSVALSQIARGSGVVFNVAGACGLGALGAAADKGVWGIGVDVDQSYLGAHILTSATLRLDRGVVNAIERLQRGRFTGGGNTVFDLRNGGVELGRINAKVPRAILRRVEGLRQAILAGRVRVPRTA